MEVVDGMVKSDDNEADANGVMSCPQPWEGTGESAGWGGAWNGECEMGGFRKGNSKVVGADAAEGGEPVGEM